MATSFTSIATGGDRLTGFFLFWTRPESPVDRICPLARLLLFQNDIVVLLSLT
jgi:hypothetical protein